VGGTHATGALVAEQQWILRSQPRRVALDSNTEADPLLAAIASAADGISARRWGIAMPDPFDYALGIGRFRDVGKFDALDGVDVRAALAERLGVGPDALTFTNDADAFTLGEWLTGAGRGSQRCVGITLGTGVGSGWVAGGAVVDPGIPAGGRIHRLELDGRPLEDTMSRRAIRRAYRAATGSEDDVREIAVSPDPVAREVLRHALNGLGRAMATPIADFGADVVVIGGSMARSWDLFEPWVRSGWEAVETRPLPPLRVAFDSDTAPLVGAAYAGWQSGRQEAGPAGRTKR
jgi:glucokinase